MYSCIDNVYRKFQCFVFIKGFKKGEINCWEACKNTCCSLQKVSDISVIQPLQLLKKGKIKKGTLN